MYGILSKIFTTLFFITHGPPGVVSVETSIAGMESLRNRRNLLYERNSQNELKIGY
jgi:hypothetical protein